MRLVAVGGDSSYALDRRSSLVGSVEVRSAEDALAFVRLFSQRKTHYLFADSDFLELQKYAPDWDFWPDSVSIRQAREAGIPFDSLTVEVVAVDGGYRITRYAADWEGNVFRVVEQVGTDGTYEVLRREVLARGLRITMPEYQ
jgi:hypothetical protein